MTNSVLSRDELQQGMQFLAALSHGLEYILHEPAKGVAFVAGDKLAKQYSEGVESTTDPIEAIKIAKNILHENGFKWEIKPWKKDNETTYIKVREDGSKVIQLVFQDCMIRQSLFCYGHPQKGALCYMMYGFFCGLIEKILGVKRAELDIIHCGENACLKELVLEE
jgi:predicted hydrocarbon binding protein